MIAVARQRFQTCGGGALGPAECLFYCPAVNVQSRQQMGISMELVSVWLDDESDVDTLFLYLFYESIAGRPPPFRPARGYHPAHCSPAETSCLKQRGQVQHQECRHQKCRDEDERQMRHSSGGCAREKTGS